MGFEVSPAKKKRHAQFKKREEKRWAKKCGPVKTRIATPEELAVLRAPRRPDPR